jgi:hypothetical protein
MMMMMEAAGIEPAQGFNRVGTNASSNKAGSKMHAAGQRPRI